MPNFNIGNSNITNIIKSNSTSIISNTLKNTITIDGKKVYIPLTSPLYPGIIGTYDKCTVLKQVAVNVIDGSKLSEEGAKIFNDAKVWHTHIISTNDIIMNYFFNHNGFGSIGGEIYELVYTPDNTYFYRKQGDKAIDNTTSTYTKSENDTSYTSTYTITQFDNTSQINDENNTVPTINKLIKNDIYQNVIIVLNMDKNLCLNKSICYLKIEIIENDYLAIYKKIYVKYYNSTGLLSKQLFNFDISTDKEKDILQNGFIKITAYQLIDYTDPNPYVIGKFKISDFLNKSNITTLYKFLEINNAYRFTFDSINIYPTLISGETYKFVNSYLSIYQNGNILNGESVIKKTYTYTMDYNYIILSGDYLKFNVKAFVINIDDNKIWDDYHDFYCNITFYLKDGKSYVLPNLLFNKLGKQLIFNEVVEVKELKALYKDIIKFSITYIGGSKFNQKTKINDIKLSLQGNIINN